MGKLQEIKKMNAEVISVFPHKIRIVVDNLEEFKFKDESLKVGSYLKVEEGTHSMRKTWGYWTYKASKYNIGLIMDVFNHSSQKMTLRYIGISQDQKDELYSLVQF